MLWTALFVRHISRFKKSFVSFGWTKRHEVVQICYVGDSTDTSPFYVSLFSFSLYLFPPSLPLLPYLSISLFLSISIFLSVFQSPSHSLFLSVSISHSTNSRIFLHEILNTV